MLPRRRVNKSQPVALWHYSHWPRRIGAVGKGGPQGVRGARRGLRHDWVGQYRKVKSEGERGRERVVGKAAGDEGRLYTWRWTGLADEVGSDAAGGEGGQGPLNQMA